ncbi:RNA-binding, partial [Paramuricea clavata]
MGEPCKVHVGNLSYSVTEEALRQAFEACGDIDEAIVVTDRETGRPRGFGFVTFQEKQGADKAIADLDGT